MGLNYQSTDQRFGSDYESEDTCVPSETESLKDPRGTRRMSTGFWIFVAALILGLPLFFETSTHLVNQCPLSYEARERMRDQEKRERQKMDMFWDQVEAHHCTTYGTRGYTAYLANLPIDYPNRIEACKETKLEIRGGSYFPKHCEDQGPGIVMGRWELNHNEPDCAPFWSWFRNKGCTSEGSGKRRFEHFLEHLPYGGDWREFCATTPVSFHGMHFPGAEICFQHNGGTYGQWEVEDSTC
ncbi:hypothetical protein PISMIDRAFT_689809 [Pisolithus microcarpus 441]|uniref:Uncharacterized protein n=1 Tax=Pisolithus microcarpus 441 TaxID=765257 RepID=A0A0C9Y514_9AGAM|nr:hypothetical protein BKA83DRAFT_689809 [Pisolithus microcarpus]KIK12096.1 hypothetical protein PISMIDRAFT_689809 [Pisolithus microcarpus 441]